MMKARFIMIFVLLVIGSLSCNQQKSTEINDMNDKKVNNEILNPFPDWVKNANIYEVNIRQYTAEGNFSSFEKHLPRLKELGVDILWLMPIFPVGEKNRKGELGSYYSVKDYKGVNPEFGSLEEFRKLVDKIHEMGMYVILDWVANHTSWDNQIIVDHPEWYIKDSIGNIVTPVEDWTDVADLDYNNSDMRDYMLGALKFWIQEYDIDGYRCDVAGMVPLDFWNETRPELNKIKPVFMLAESEEPGLLKSAFDMDYSWDLHHLMNDIAKGNKNVIDLTKYFIDPPHNYSLDDIRMNFITNHDENSWNGTVNERMGEAANALAVLSIIVPGMPLLYSGQEAGLNKRLEFFEKDEIEWKDHKMTEIYKTLYKLKKNNAALWNGDFGGEMKIISTTEDESVFAFIRERDNNKVFVVINLSPETKRFTFSEKCYCDNYTDVFSGNSFEILDEIGMELGPWEYLVCEKK